MSVNPGFVDNRLSKTYDKVKKLKAPIERKGVSVKL
jgi:pentose-5-phosphate-3-epimerase